MYSLVWKKIIFATSNNSNFGADRILHAQASGIQFAQAHMAHAVALLSCASARLCMLYAMDAQCGHVFHRDIG